MKHKALLAICLLATIITAGTVFGISLVSNHLGGTSQARPSLVLTGQDLNTTTTLSENTVGPTYVGDIFHLTATLTDLTDRLVTFYNNGVTIGSVTSVGGVATIDFFVASASWDLHAEATY